MTRGLSGQRHHRAREPSPHISRSLSSRSPGGPQPAGRAVDDATAKWVLTTAIRATLKEVG